MWWVWKATLVEQRDNGTIEMAATARPMPMPTGNRKIFKEDTKFNSAGAFHSDHFYPQLPLNSNAEKPHSKLRNLAEYYCSMSLYESASFWAERLYYEDPCERNLHLWAQTFYRLGKVQPTYLMLKKSRSVDNRYLFAQCCINLDKLHEAENALTLSSSSGNYDSETPGGACGLLLMGIICRRSNRTEKAIQFFRKCLQMDSTQWEALRGLAELGAKLDPASLFGLDMDTALDIFNGNTSFGTANMSTKDGDTANATTTDINTNRVNLK